MVAASALQLGGAAVVRHVPRAQLRRGGAGAALAGFTIAACQGYEAVWEWRGKLSWRCSPCLGPTTGVERFILPVRSLTAIGAPARCEQAKAERPTLVVFLGDSLVAGVGGQELSEQDLPAALPHSVAKRLAGLTRSEVRWTSVGIVGAGVEQIRTEGLPALRRCLLERGDKVEDVVVVLVLGVNDLRLGNLWNYRSQLRELVSDLKHVGSKGRAVDGVFLPEFDLCESPLLQRWPLRLFLQPVWSAWEREKREAISDQHHATMLEASLMSEVPSGVFCGDEMHPSLRGYQLWADSLAQQIQGHLREKREKVKERAEAAAERFRAERRQLRRKIDQIFARVDVC